MLLLVVGPTGAGKDTLLRAARQHLAADSRFRFVRRVLTRKPQPSGPEDYETATEAQFHARRLSGGFAVHWRTNGVFFGLPAGIALDIAAASVVVANASRMIIPELRPRFPLRVIEITAPADLLARRLAALGHNDAMDTARRLSRAVGLPPGIPSETVVNDGSVEHGTRKLVAALLRAGEAAL